MTYTPVEPLCAGRDCLVVGSAPGLALPEPLPSVILGANGGAALVPRCDILATTSHLFRQDASRQEQATRRSLAGLATSSVWVDEKNGSIRQAVLGLCMLEVKFDRVCGVPPKLRDLVTRMAIGQELWVSTGVWAACLAIASGAESVSLAGISLGKGHAGMDWDDARRDHVEEDRAALKLLAGKGVTLPEELRRAIA